MLGKCFSRKQRNGTDFAETEAKVLKPIKVTNLAEILNGVKLFQIPIPKDSQRPMLIAMIKFHFF